MADTTTIEVSRENWRRLNAQKEPGDSFDDALGRVLDRAEGGGASTAREPDDEAAESGEAVPAECDKCGHTWSYSGSRDAGQWVTCPQCKSSVKL